MRRLRDIDVSLIETCLMIGREKFEANAKMLREAGEAALAEAFETQRTQAELLRQAFEDGPDVLLDGDVNA